MIRKKIFAAGLCLCVCMTCFASCGKKEVVYVDEEAGSRNAGTLTETMGIPEHVRDQRGKVKVDADVIGAERYGSLSSATVAYRTWSEQDIQSFAEAVFDKGSIEVVLPYRYCDKDFLFSEREEIEKRIFELGFTKENVLYSPQYCYLFFQLSQIEECLNDYDAGRVVENDGSYQWVEYVEPGAEDLWHICCVKGTVGGREYGMWFTKDIEGSYSDMYLFQIKWINAPELYRGSFNIQADNISPDVELTNISSLTEKEAILEAEALVKRLGIESLVVTGAYLAGQDDVEGETVYDAKTGESYYKQVITGYLVHFGRELDGVTTPCIGAYQHRYGNEVLTVLVTDDGAEELQYFYPMKITGIQKAQEEMMSFEEIHEIAMEYMSGGSHEINCIRYCMGYVKEDGSYKMVPVWCYEYNDTEYVTNVWRGAFMIDALKGRVINPCGEMSREEE